MSFLLGNPASEESSSRVDPLLSNPANLIGLYVSQIFIKFKRYIFEISSKSMLAIIFC